MGGAAGIARPECILARPTDILRGSVRRTIDVPARVDIAEASAAQVAPIHGSSLPGRMTDVSAGGAHVIVSTFVPRATRVIVEPIGTAAGGQRLAARVMRVQMVDREPHYGLGLRFDEPQTEAARMIEASAAEGDAA
jgi:hypothetical protein